MTEAITRPDDLQLSLPGFEEARDRWQREYDAGVDAQPVQNRSGIEVKPLYTPQDWDSSRYLEDLGFPGQLPLTRGIYPTMHRGRPWSSRQLIGLGIPEDYNARLKEILAAGGTAISLIPCNSFMRGYDIDEVDSLLVGTCGTAVNTLEDIEICFRDVDLSAVSTALNDPLPFTGLALLLALARRRNVPWSQITGTSNQSDYISHYVANHMFYRLALPGSRRVLTDHIAFTTEQVPGWNPVSVVGQHMQQAGATPAEAMGFTLCTAIQYAEDCMARGMSPDSFLPRFTFFFDVSISFFEEIAKFRAGRRIWARVARERLGATDPRSWRFKFHGQTSGVDLTRQQPLNNVARVSLQALAGILGGLQSLHTDAYDEVLSTPTEDAARIAIATQTILRDEAHLVDVIDPLGGAYYVETLTDQMEERIEAVMAQVDAAGGMYAAVESGMVQKTIGASAVAFQDAIDSSRQVLVGVNAHVQPESRTARQALERPDPARVDAQLQRLASFKRNRSQDAVRKGLDGLATAATGDHNLYAAAVEAALAGATHGEMVACLRRELGFGHPLVVA